MAGFLVTAIGYTLWRDSAGNLLLAGFGILIIITGIITAIVCFWSALTYEKVRAEGLRKLEAMP